MVAEAAAEAISAPGFVPAFSLFDPSTEVPVQDLPAEVRHNSSIVAVCAGACRHAFVCNGFQARRARKKCSSGAPQQFAACAGLDAKLDYFLQRRPSKVYRMCWSPPDLDYRTCGCATCPSRLPPPKYVCDRHTSPPLVIPAPVCYDILPKSTRRVKVSAMVSEAILEQLMPFVSLEYGSLGGVSLDDRLLYVEHYEAYHEVCVCVCLCLGGGHLCAFSDDCSGPRLVGHLFRGEKFTP